MRPRDEHEPGRVASSLELFFDLVFVVAVSISAVSLHHALTEGHVLDGLRSYAVVFFGIWWAWMNFTWFATSFDTDDWLYRVLTIVQMAGVLILAAGVEPAFNDSEFDVVVYGYVVMRVAMVAQWLRASRGAGAMRRTTMTYALGIAGVQVLWLAWLLTDGWVTTVGLVVLIAVEVGIPVIAEQSGTTPWHPHHITERYGLFTLILLGESLLASANAVIEALHDDEALGPLISIAVLALVVTAALWWIYFWPHHHEAIGSLGASLRYGYTHYFIFAAAGALSAGIEVEIATLTHHSELSDTAAAFSVSIPVAVFLLGIWFVAIRNCADSVVNTVVPAAAALVLLDPVMPIPVTLTALVLVLVVVVLVLRDPVPNDE
ncbi:MAG: low temperature requirement protein A [Nocardioidaceae bacterium]|nr:MAG: low temperature requirement protein A [Nocardioidaceae bacterium]